MRRFAPAAAGLLILGLCACDKKEGGEASMQQASLNLEAPEPARFAKPGPPPADGGGGGAQERPQYLPDPEQLKSAPKPDPSRIAQAPSSLEELAAGGALKFDGAKRRKNSPIPDYGSDAQTVVLANRQMAIDTDGKIADPALRRAVVSRDPWHQDGTALSAGGRPLDPTVVPYISIPGDFKGARKGDLALVSYDGRSTWAVIGDVGPKGRFGEGSVALAKRLGIPSDGTTGGVKSGVTYTLFPGTRLPRYGSQDELLSHLESRNRNRTQLASL